MPRTAATSPARRRRPTTWRRWPASTAAGIAFAALSSPGPSIEAHPLTALPPDQDTTAARPAVDRIVVVVAVVAAAYALLAFLLPHPYPSFDEAKYLAIGQNALAGRGPQTAFGANFLPHSPFWPMLVAAPKVVLGLDPWSWGYLLNALAGAGVLLLAGRFAARFGGAGRLLAVAILVGWLDLFLLTRTARLDVPEAALTLAYLAVAMSAIETGLVRRGILAGALFAWAFLVKESSLVLLGAPFIAAIATRRPVGRIARAAGLVLLVTIPMVSWWFGWYQATVGRVYALGLGGGLLLPLAGVLVVLGVVLLVLGLDRAPGVRLAAWLDARLSRRRVAGTVGTLLVIAWIAAFLFAFSRSDVQAGRPLLDIPSLARWGRAWVPDLAPILLAAIGVMPAYVTMARGDDRPVALLVTIAVGAPWVLLVAVLGEPPRNLITIIAVLVALSAGGWIAVAGALDGHPRARMATGATLGTAVAMAIDLQLAHAGIAASITKGLLGIAGGAVLGAVVGAVATSDRGRGWIRGVLRATRRPESRAPDLTMAAVGLVMALSLGALGAASARIALASSDSSRSYVASEVAVWLHANIPAGSTVMFGAMQANETAVVLGGTYRLRSLQATMGVTDPAAPLGVRVGGQPVSDLVVMDRHPRQDGFFVFTGAQIERSLQAAQPVAWVYVTGIATATPSMVDWLATAPGITLATTIDSSPGLATPLTARIYRVDMGALRVPTAKLYASSEAINAQLDALQADPSAPSIAGALLDRVVITDPGPAGDAAIARLHQVAGR